MGRQYREVIKEEEFIYIPVLDTLEKMINQDSILNEVGLCNVLHDCTVDCIN